MKLLYAITLPVIFLGGMFGMIESKKVVLSDGSKVAYNIDENKTLNGAYSVSSLADKLWLRGSYKDNVRVGNWYCFNNDGSTVLRYNYDLKKVIVVDDKMAAKLRFTLAEKDPKVLEKATVPVPICSIDQYVSLFNEQITTVLTREQKNLPAEVPVDIIANIDAKGSVSYKLAYTVNKLNYTTKLVIREKMYDLEWSPSTYEGKIIPAEITISSKFAYDGSQKQRFIWNY